ncbi:MAG: fluoride efflux transporter CrcB [Paramuribaculum sp.]|nr:fluoride efflux transporter CrcB [Paramuribaculum sp.]
MVKLILSVFVGSGMGGVMRYLVNLATDRFFPAASRCGEMPVPAATFAVNIAGCFLIGVFYAVLSRCSSSWPDSMRLMLTTGFCGGLTTFSTFSQESLTLIQNGHIACALLYIGVSLIAGLAAVYLGTLLISAR